jgi:hypothetical protein
MTLLKAWSIIFYYFSLFYLLARFLFLALYVHKKRRGYSAISILCFKLYSYSSDIVLYGLPGPYSLEDLDRGGGVHFERGPNLLGHRCVSALKNSSTVPANNWPADYRDQGDIVCTHA